MGVLSITYYEEEKHNNPLLNVSKKAEIGTLYVQLEVHCLLEANTLFLVEARALRLTSSTLLFVDVVFWFNLVLSTFSFVVMKVEKC